jgi:hypothetical protein
MAKLIYSAIASLDGYLQDDEGRFDWVAFAHSHRPFMDQSAQNTPSAALR